MEGPSPLNVDPALLDLFRAEVETHLPTLSDGLLVLEKDPARVDLFEALMRAAHSIKGAARVVGVHFAVEIAHVIEDCFVALRQGRVMMSASVVDALLQGVDLLQRVTQTSDPSANAPGVDTVAVRDVSEAIAQCTSGQATASSLPPDLPQARHGPVSATRRPESIGPSAPRLPQLREFVAEAREHLTAVCSHLLNLEKATGDDGRQRVQQLLRAVHSIKGGAGFSGCHTIEQVAHLVESVLEAVDRGEVAKDSPTVDVLLTATDRITALVDDAEHSNDWDVSDVLTRLEALLAAGDTFVAGDKAIGDSGPEALPAGLPPGGAPASAVAISATTPGIDRVGTLRIPVGLTDRLMTLAGELVLVRNQTRRFTEANQPLPGPVIQRLDTVTGEFQETILQTRMQPVANVFGRFPRLVRDLARQLGKQIELEMAGTEVEMDKTILDLISDPLTHLVRNSCDHGIESPEDRTRAGKAPEGRITLTARHLGDQICITVADDGRGIDRAAVSRRAIEHRVRTPDEIARLDDKELLALILLPGFSTASQVTDLSGRGVGMDVVKTNLAQVGGSLEIESVTGRGTTFNLCLPLTLAIIPCLLVEAAGQRYAITQKDLEGLVCVHPGQPQARIEKTVDQEVIRLRGRLLPLVRLPKLLSAGDRADGCERAAAFREADCADSSVLLAVVKSGSRRFGLVVDSVVASEEIVVKPMHASLRHLSVYSGATILGDGRVALILNADGIARQAGVRFGSDAESTPQFVRPTNAETQSLLLFRAGRQEQFAVPLGAVRRIVMVHRDQLERVGERVFTTIDGVPTRLVRPEGLLALSSANDAPIMFVLLPKGTDGALGFLVNEILDTVAGVTEFGPPAISCPGVLGSAVLGGRITSLLDFGQLASACSAMGDPRSTAEKYVAGANILLVEDTRFFRDLVKGYLESAGHRVVLAEQGAEALDRLKEGPFDLVISDLEMPVMDGWTFAAAVRRLQGGDRIPMLALTTRTSAADREKAMGCGFNAYQVKLDRSEFLETVERLLRNVEQPQLGGSRQYE